MRLVPGQFSTLRAVFVVLAMGALAACENTGPGAENPADAKSTPPPKADYQTHTDHFQALQQAAENTNAQNTQIVMGVQQTMQQVVEKETKKFRLEGKQIKLVVT